MATTTVSHPNLGNIKASSAKEGVTQFLGLQYATLADRFAPPIMKEYTKSDTIDATRISPQVLSLVLGADGEHGLIQHAVEYDRSQHSMSDTEGLCLNITVPKSQDGTLDAEGRLPVVTFIHGGGFNNGSGMFPHYDMARFVQLSVKEGMPCIAVVLNYRLGAPGLLTSGTLRSAGYKSNNNFRDQRTALLWIKKHISGFGGDPDNVTLMGESAGGISVCYHLFSKEPLFKRMMSMSGTQLLMPPMRPEEAEANWLKALEALGLLHNDNPVQALLNMDGKEMMGKMMQAGIPFMPVLDGDLCPTNFDFTSITNKKTEIPGEQWCEAAILGDCQFDGNIQGLRLAHRKKGIAQQFHDAISKGLSDSPNIANRIFAAYDLSDPEMEDDEAFFRVLQVSNDLQFYIPTLTLAQRLEPHMKTYMYRFNEPNPWDGTWKGHATHILDLAFFLQNFNDFLDPPQREMAENFAKDVIRYANGKDAWDQWSQQGNRVAKVMGPKGKVEMMEDTPENVGRRRIMLELGGEAGLDKLNEAFSYFMRTAPPPV